jgi:ABC-2 family transporter protein
VTLLAGEVVSFATFLAGQAVLGSGKVPYASFGEPGVLRAVALPGVFLALLALLGLGLGAIMPHSAGAVATFATIMLVLPLLLAAAPGHLGRFMPETMLTSSVAAVIPQTASQALPPGWDGFLIMAAYSAAALLTGGALFWAAGRMNTLEELMVTTVPAIPAGHARFAGALRAEWTKLRTVRSTRWLLIALVVATVALGVGLSASEATSVAHESAARKASFDPANWSLAVLGFTQVFFGVLGALSISNEYSTGTISSSLAALPRRLRLLAAKLTVLGLAALLAGELVTIGAVLFTRRDA